MSGWDEANEAATVIHDALEREAWRCEVTGDDEDLTKMADLALDALAAAGYTVTKGRYEPAGWWESEAGHRVFGIAPAPGDNAAPLYRKIEGSTDV